MISINKDKIGNLIIKLRRNHNLSQEEMASILHVSSRTIRNWEKGISLPSMEDVVSICNHFNLSLEEVYEGELNLDKEFNRRVKDINNEIKDINEKVNSTDNVIKELNNEFHGFKDLFNMSILDNKKTTYILLIIMFLAHLIAALTNYFCFAVGVVDILIAFLTTLAYIFVFTYSLFKSKRNITLLTTMFIYTIIVLVFEYFTVHFNNYSPRLNVSNTAMLVNGPLYALTIFNRKDIRLLYIFSAAVYFSWILIDGQFMLSYFENEVIRKFKDCILKKRIIIYVVLLVVALALVATSISNKPEKGMYSYHTGKITNEVNMEEEKIADSILEYFHDYFLQNNKEDLQLYDEQPLEKNNLESIVIIKIYDYKTIGNDVVVYLTMFEEVLSIENNGEKTIHSGSRMEWKVVLSKDTDNYSVKDYVNTEFFETNKPMSYENKLKSMFSLKAYVRFRRCNIIKVMETMNREYEKSVARIKEKK